MSDQSSNTPGTQPNAAGTGLTAAADNLYAPPTARVDDVVPEGETVLADRGTRLGAAIIFQVALNLLLDLNIYSQSAPPSMLMTAMLQLASVGFYVALNYHLLAKNGQSIGKKLLNIKIVRSDGSKADIGRILGFRLSPVWLVG